ncbi:MAG: hypothetical protein DHS20C11_00190 [Lysobacteraceae bacterium]|nr:MAG: hypothetical protein DHS20C11_00190 [Xanthomonadaceae bacterium]
MVAKKVSRRQARRTQAVWTANAEGAEKARWLAQVFKALGQQMGDRRLAIGAGHCNEGIKLQPADRVTRLRQRRQLLSQARDTSHSVTIATECGSIYIGIVQYGGGAIGESGLHKVNTVGCMPLHRNKHVTGLNLAAIESQVTNQD